MLRAPGRLATATVDVLSHSLCDGGLRFTGLDGKIMISSSRRVLRHPSAGLLWGLLVLSPLLLGVSDARRLVRTAWVTPAPRQVRGLARYSSLSSSSTTLERRVAVDERTQTSEGNQVKTDAPKKVRKGWRRLGSFEKLLTRKFQGTGDRLSIPHVCAAEVSGPCEVEALKRAVGMAVERHPLLRACIDGDGKVQGTPLAGVRAGAAEPRPLVWKPCAMTTEEIVQRVLQVTRVEAGGLTGEWQSRFQHALDATDVDLSTGPLWRLHVLVAPSAFTLLFAFDHGMSDQVGTNTLLHELLRDLHSPPPRGSALSSPLPMPLSIEQAVLGLAEGEDAEPSPPSLNTLAYALREGALGAHPVVLLPHAYTVDQAVQGGQRRTIAEFRTLDPLVLGALVERCRAAKVTVTAALCAAMLLTATDFAHAPDDRTYHLYRFLLSLNMRQFPANATRKGQEWGCGAMACAGGAMDFMERLQGNSGRAMREAAAAAKDKGEEEGGVPEAFWTLAQDCRHHLLDFVSRGWVAESVRLFDWGVKTIELNDVVEMEADNPATSGRAYSCGVSNMGIFQGGTGGVEYGPRKLQSVHYATSHSLTGSLYQLSCGTVGGRLCLTLHFAEPLVERRVAREFADAFVDLVTIAAR